MRKRGTPHCKVVQRRELLCHREIEARLCFLLIGDGRGADLEIALRGRELFGDRALLRQDRFEIVLRAEHGEVRLRDPHDQFLANPDELRFTKRNLQLALLEQCDVLQPIQRITELDAVVLPNEAVAWRKVGVRYLRGDRCAGSDLRQQCAARLWNCFTGGGELRQRAGNLGVVGLRGAVSLHQVQREGRPGQSDADRGGDGSRQ